MASVLIHMAVAKKVNEKLNLTEKDFYLGVIAPDAAKIVGIERFKTHFTNDKNTSTPNIKFFLKKYEKYIGNAFECGYLVHLITDVLWYDEFLKNYVNGIEITNKYGEKIKTDNKTIREIIYNDYTNLNSKLLEYYNLDLSLFYETFKYPQSHINELPNKYFDKLIDKMGNVCMDLSNYSYLLNIEAIVHFIEYSTIYVLDELKKYNI